MSFQSSARFRQHQVLEELWFTSLISGFAYVNKLVLTPLMDLKHKTKLLQTSY